MTTRSRTSVRATVGAVLVVLLAWEPVSVGVAHASFNRSREIGALSPGTPVYLRLKDGSRLRGVVTEVTAEGIVLASYSRARGVEHQLVQFDQIKAVQKAKNWKPGKKTAILMWVGLGVLLTLVLLYTYLNAQ